MRRYARLAATGAGLATAGLVCLGVAPWAFAGQVRTVTAVTHTSDHPDTTSVSGPCTVASPGGPVWAHDNLSLRLSVTPETGPGNYSVTITAHGSFKAIADPTTGVCYTGSGSVDGWLQYDVTSSTPPDPKNLPAREPSDMTQGQILDQLFAGNATIVGGGHYSYTYNRIDGGKYTQIG